MTKSMMKYVFLFIMAMLVSGVTTPADAQISRSVGQVQYQNCLNQILDDPNAAYQAGLEWRDNAGGLPAKHCMAMALVDMNMIEPAARVMQEIADDFQMGQGMVFANMMDVGNMELLAEIYLVYISII